MSEDDDHDKKSPEAIRFIDGFFCLWEQVLVFVEIGERNEKAADSE